MFRKGLGTGETPACHSPGVVVSLDVLAETSALWRKAEPGEAPGMLAAIEPNAGQVPVWPKDLPDHLPE